MKFFAYISNKFAALALAVAFALIGMAALSVSSAFASGETECPKGMKRPDYDWRSPCLSAPALGKGEDAPRLTVDTEAVNGVCRQTLSLTGVALGVEHDVQSRGMARYSFVASAFALSEGYGFNDLPHDIGSFYAVPPVVNGEREYRIESVEVRHNPMTVRYALHNASQNYPTLRYRIYGQHSGGGWLKEWDFRVVLTESVYPSAMSAALSDCEAEEAERREAKAEADQKADRALEAKLTERIAALTAERDRVRERADARAADWGFPY